MKSLKEYKDVFESKKSNIKKEWLNDPMKPEVRRKLEKEMAKVTITMEIQKGASEVESIKFDISDLTDKEISDMYSKWKSGLKKSYINSPDLPEKTSLYWKS